MKKLLLLFAALLIYPSAGAQKIIYIRDSTALKQYFGNAMNVIAPPPTDKKVTQGTQIIRGDSKPEEKNEGLRGGLRIIRHDDAATLRKELAGVTRNMDWASVLTAPSRLQFRAYINREGGIDSLAYFRIHTDTARQNRNFRMRDKLGKMEEGDLRTRLEKEWKKIAQNYTGTSSESPDRTASGSIYLYTKQKNLDEFLNSQPENITEINLTDYGLREFPHQLKRFRRLKTINLKDNYIASATIDRKDYPKLVSISFQNNLLRDGSLRFTGGKGPTAINLNDNHFTRLPKTCRKVKYLYLANSGLREISPKDIRKIKKVQSLNLYSNNITKITPKITRLKKLKELDLYRNQLTSLNHRITRLKKLETLAISYNKLEELPAGIHAMAQLTTLYSHHNKLKALPLLPPNLEVLDVGYNQIEDVSERVQPLKKLKTLDYSNNRVKGDLNFLLELPRIQEIYLWENRYAATDEEEKYFSRVFSELVNKGVTIK